MTTVLPGNALAASFPPSAGVFTDPATMSNIGKILMTIDSPLMVNVYPYFAYTADPSHISLDYALFNSEKPVVVDGPYLYYNMFDAMVNAFKAALGKIGYGKVKIAVAETGWPSGGDGAVASKVNAQAYNSRLMNHVLHTGTPRRPKLLMETFIFEMFNENMKQPGVEQNFGFFYPNMQPVYPFW